MSSPTEELFNFLYQSAMLHHHHSAKIGPSRVRVPDTVIYKCSQPIYWYYLSSEGWIAREGKKKITHKSLLQEFASGGEGSEVVATSYSFQSKGPREGRSK